MDTKIIKHPHVAWGPLALTEVGASDAFVAGIYRGDVRAVKRGIPSRDGVLHYFRASGGDIGESNTNSGQARLDHDMDVEGLAFRIQFPRTICDGADLLDAAGAVETDPLAARILASKYTRFYQLFRHHTYLVWEIAGEEVARVALNKVGSGPEPEVEGLAVQAGAGQVLVDSAVTPGVAAFSVRCGEGRGDIWSLGKEGRFLKEGQAFTIKTITDTGVVNLINTRILNTIDPLSPVAAATGLPGTLYEDAKIGIRLKVGLVGSKYQRVGQGIRA